MNKETVAKEVLGLARPTVKKLKPYASAKNEFADFHKDLIYLDANENPYETGYNRYPDPNQTALKKVLSRLKGIPTENMLLGNGSDEILDMIFRVFCEPEKDHILINVPTFGMYQVLAGINNVACKKVLLTNDFQLDVANIIKSTDAHTKVIFICSPNNPTGNLMRKKDILRLVKSLHAMVVIDEAYIDFSDSASWLNEVAQYKNLIVIQTLSKAYGLAGLRLGICYADQEVIGLLKKIKMPYNVNVLSQVNAIKCLENEEAIKSNILKIRNQKILLKKEINQMEFVDKIYDSDANFLLIKVDDADKRYAQLIENGVVVRNRTKEPLCKNCLRITVGTEIENKKLIKVFKSF